MGRWWISVIIVMLFLASVPGGSQAEGGTPTITGVRVIKGADGLGVELSADRNLVYNCYRMPKAHKVVMDFPGTAPGRPDTLYRVNAEMIDTLTLVKATVNDVMITRVTVNLTEDADFRIEAGRASGKAVTIHFSHPAPAGPTPAASLETERDRATSASVQKPGKLPEPVIPVPVTPARSRDVADVNVSSIDISLDAIIVKAGNAIKGFTSFTLSGPDRLVIDIPSVTCTLGAIDVPSNRFGIVRARAGMFDGKLRLVFEAGKKRLKKLSVVPTERGLKVVLAAGR